MLLRRPPCTHLMKPRSSRVSRKPWFHAKSSSGTVRQLGKMTIATMPAAEIGIYSDLSHSNSNLGDTLSVEEVGNASADKLVRDESNDSTNRE